MRLDGGVRRAIDGSGTLRSLAQHRRVQYVINTVRAARVLAPAPRVLVGQVTGGTAAYTLRGRGTTVSVRHRSRDIDILAEVFAKRDYEPPCGIGTVLDGPIRVLDLGGNIGLFGAYAFGRWQVMELHSFEPDPENLELLRATASPFAPRWKITEAAVATRPGRIRFRTGLLSESRRARDGEPGIDVPMLDLFSEPRCDLMKMDIEGGEWPILNDPRIRGFARAIVMEWHSVDGYTPEDARALLALTGYEHQWEPSQASEGNGRLWAWR